MYLWLITKAANSVHCDVHNFMKIWQGRPWGLVVYQYTWKQTISPQIHAKCQNFENKVNIMSMKGSIVASECRILDLSLPVYRIPNLTFVVHKHSVYVWSPVFTSFFSIRLVWYCAKSNIGNILKIWYKICRFKQETCQYNAQAAWGFKFTVISLHILLKVIFSFEYLLTLTFGRQYVGSLVLWDAKFIPFDILKARY